MTVEIRVLRPDDDRRAFRSGDAALDLYLQRYAGQNQFRHHVGVTYVAVEGGILGFVTVAPGSVDADDLPSGRTMPPYPLPVLRIARLAVAEGQQGRGLGRALLRFTIELAERMRDEFGCVGLLVDAKRSAIGFYETYGFEIVTAESGVLATRPAPTLMFLALGAVPPRKRS